MSYIVSTSGIAIVDQVDITEVTVAIVVAWGVVVVAGVTGSWGAGLHVAVAWEEGNEVRIFSEHLLFSYWSSNDQLFINMDVACWYIINKAMDLRFQM